MWVGVGCGRTGISDRRAVRSLQVVFKVLRSRLG